MALPVTERCLPTNQFRVFFGSFFFRWPAPQASGVVLTVADSGLLFLLLLRSRPHDFHENEMQLMTLREPLLFKELYRA